MHSRKNAKLRLYRTCTFGHDVLCFVVLLKVCVVHVQLLPDAPPRRVVTPHIVTRLPKVPRLGAPLLVAVQRLHSIQSTGLSFTQSMSSSRLQHCDRTSSAWIRRYLAAASATHGGALSTLSHQCRPEPKALSGRLLYPLIARCDGKMQRSTQRH